MLNIYRNTNPCRLINKTQDIKTLTSANQTACEQPVGGRGDERRGKKAEGREEKKKKRTIVAMINGRSKEGITQANSRTPLPELYPLQAVA